MFSTILAVALGGAIGSVARYGVNIGTAHIWGIDYPWGTIIVNIVGSFLMGILIAKFAQMDHQSNVFKSFLATGVLGGFTTFSAFSLDFVTLWERAEFLQALVYLFISIMVSIGALFVGLWIIRGWSA